MARRAVLLMAVAGTLMTACSWILGVDEDPVVAEAMTDAAAQDAPNVFDTAIPVDSSKADAADAAEDADEPDAEEDAPEE